MSSIEHRQSALAFPRLPQGVSGAGWRILLDTSIALLREWRRRSVERDELARLDERMLHDIGISASDVDYEVRKPFWRSSRNWRDSVG